MSRSTVVYIVMVAVFAAGLWVILGFGNRALRAPEDLAGDWEVRPPDGQGAPATPMRVEQSGRFLKITFGGERKAVTMKMLDDKLADEADSADLRSITLEGDDRQARFRGLHRSDRWSLRIDGGAMTGDWRADLVNRTYPRRKPTTQRAAATPPPASPDLAQADSGPTGHAR
jgi:hypothetical protein